MMWNLQSYTTTVLNKRMWQMFSGGQNILWPSYILSWSQDSGPPQLPRIYAPDCIMPTPYLGGVIIITSGIWLPVGAWLCINSGEVVYVHVVPAEGQSVMKGNQWCSATGKVAMDYRKVMAACSRYGFGHLQAGCPGPELTPETIPTYRAWDCALLRYLKLLSQLAVGD